MNWFYFLLFEWGNRGRTPGKMALGLRVVSVDGTSLDLLQILIRNLVRPADMFPMSLVLFPTYFVGGADDVFRRPLGFAVSGIWPRVRSLCANRRPRLNMNDAGGAAADRAAALSAELHMRVYPSAALSQALNDFAGGYMQLNPARALEIARGVEEPIRRFFGAVNLDCTPVELLLAAHHYLYSMDQDELASFAPLTADGRSGSGF